MLAECERDIFIEVAVIVFGFELLYKYVCEQVRPSCQSV